MPKRRKSAPRYAEKSKPIVFRIQPITDRLLRQRAKENKRTLSAECEHQLHRALTDIGDGPTHAILATLEQTLNQLTRFKSGKPVKAAKWWDDPYLFGQALRATLHLFNMLAPPGFKPLTPEETFKAGGQQQGRTAVDVRLDELQLTEAVEKPFAKRTPHERKLVAIREDFGALIERPLVWGKTARERDEFRSRLSSTEYGELVELRRKEAKPNTKLTENERERMYALVDKMLGGQE